MAILDWICHSLLPFCLVVCVVFVLLYLLLFAPVVYFLLYGWHHRRNNILNNFTEATAAYYVRCFHRSESLAVVHAIEASEATVRQGTHVLEQVPQLRAQAATARAAGQTPEADRLENEATTLESQAPANRQAGETALHVAQQAALVWVRDYYNSQFGRRRFLLPLFLLLTLAACGLHLIAVSIIQWQANGSTAAGVLPLAVVLALAGGFTWVLFDLIARAASEELSPSDLFRSSFRLAIAVPVGYAFGKAFDPALALPMAYLLGTLPTATIMTVAGRVTAKWMQLTDAPRQAQTSLQKLVTVDTFLAERFADEGITTVEQLAYTDPVRLSIRTGLNFSVLLCCTGEALLGIYWREPEQLAHARKYGLSGAYECAQLWGEFLAGDPVARARTNAIIDCLVTDLQTPRVGVENVLIEVAFDPFTLFQRACWAATMGEDE